MLKNVPKIISPELLKVLCEMGHGDEIVIADANYPAETNGKIVVRADGLGGNALLEAILELIPLDTYAEFNMMLMNTTNGDPAPKIWETYRKTALKDENLRLGFLERQEFYDRSKNAYAIIASGEEAVYANVNSAQISQMVSLLTENASKYVTEEGDVVISLFRMGRNIIFKIYNTATIDDSVDLNRLFDRFYRSDSSRNSKTGGHGIGLSVVWRIAQNHKGRVFCKREEGGVSFTATISNRIRVRRQKQKKEKD